MAIRAWDGDGGSVAGGVYLRSFIIGSGFFTVALIEPMYNAYVPLMLADHLASSFALGAILSLLNVIAPLIIPVFSAMSDRTQTAIGRRMPYIVAFLPPAALALAFVPMAAALGLVPLIAALAAMNVLRHAARGPVVSLMPDLVPEQHRSKANGVINTMGGIAAITATVVLAPFVSRAVRVPGVGVVGRVVPFWIIAGLILAATVFLFATVREPGPGEPVRGEPTRRDEDDSRARRSRLRDAVPAILRQPRGPAVGVLAAVLLWFLAWKSIIPFITIYARDGLGASESAAGLSFGMIAVSQTAAAIPAGILADRVGRRRLIRGALVVLTVVGIGLFANDLAVARWDVDGLLVFWALLLLLGTAWAVLITNCLPLLWDIGGPGTVGLYTGLYYFASQSAPVVGPGLGGVLLDIGGFGVVALGFAIMMVLAGLVLGADRSRR